MLLQKRILLQVPEQWDAVENEILVHRQIKHKNVIHLVESEMKGSRDGQGMALLVFPFYRVRFNIYESSDCHT